MRDHITGKDIPEPIKELEIQEPIPLKPEEQLKPEAPKPEPPEPAVIDAGSEAPQPTTNGEDTAL